MKKNITVLLRPSIATSALICAFLLAGLGDGDAQSQSDQNTNASLQIVKAYKTFNFGDRTETVKDKLGEILGGVNLDGRGSNDPNVDRYNKDDETFWRALFDTDEEYEPYKYNGDMTSDQSDKFRSFRRNFQPVTEVSGRNNVIVVRCFQLKDNGEIEANEDFRGLVIVQVTYLTNLDELADRFVQNYPNARKENKHYKIELAPNYPGAFFEYDQPIYSDISQDRRAKLTLPAEKSTVTFTDKCQLSDSDKTALSEKMKNAPPGAPIALFASKQIIDFYMNNYHQSIEAADQEQKAKLKKESDASSGF